MAKDKGKGPGLTLLQGGKAPGGSERQGGGTKAPGAVGRAASGLTLKQEAFAVALSEGATNVEAYRKAYDASGMQATSVEVEGCKLAAHPKIAQRVQDLLAAKAAKTAHVEARSSERIWRGVWALAEGDDTPPAVKATALGLAAKLAGMLTDKVELTTPGTAQDIERELMERLARYK
jgi:hypothetical protein